MRKSNRCPRGRFGWVAVATGALSCGSPPPSAAPSATPTPVASAPAPVEPTAPVPAAPTGSGAGSTAPAGEGWQAFDTATEGSPFEDALHHWSATSQCPDYDYFPNGGIQNFWCHRPESLTLGRLRELSGVDLFVSGPHTAAGLRLGEPYTFGRYNPAFVRWLVDKAGPSPRDSALRKVSQSYYDASMRPLAEVMWWAYQKLKADEGCFAREKASYAARISARTLPRGYSDRWFFFHSPFFCQRAASVAQGNDAWMSFFYENGFDGGIEGNVTKGAVGFWLRRSMDGTMETFAEGLKKLLASYHPALLAEPMRLPDPAGINRAIDAAMAEVAKCNQPGVRGVIRFHVQPDGRLAMVKAPQMTPLLTCMAEKLATQRAPSFTGKDIPFSRPTERR